MGAELSLLTPTAQTIAISSYIDDFMTDIQYSKPLSTSRFLKTIKCLDLEGSVVVKLFIKPAGTGVDDKFNLSSYVTELEAMRSKLSDIPNVLPFTSVVESNRAGYLIRPYIRYNLYDRISTRPFLEGIEKKWIVYQLLMAISRCHEIDICHGDLKSENILTTSWNWIMVCDFASFKPVYLPEDNPSQFSFYFDASQRHNCYLAPERFLPSDLDVQKMKTETTMKLTKAMDIFALGCVIAELYSEGLPLFTLPQLFRYKKGQHVPNLDAIEDPNIRKMIQSMINLDPNKRLQAKDYLKQYRKSIFPDQFYTFLHPYLKKLSISGPELLNTTIQDRFPLCDMRIDKMTNDFDKIALYLGFNSIYENDKDSECIPQDGSILPVKLNLPGMKNHIPRSTSQIINSSSIHRSNCSSLVLLSLVLHSVRNTTHSSFRVKACSLILAFAEQVHDEAKLDRCLPYLIYMLDDPSEDVQCAALRSMTQLLSMVDAITSVNVYAFPEYIIPRIKAFLKRSYSPIQLSNTNKQALSGSGDSYVRSVFAGCLPYLTQTSQRFYEMALILKKHVELTSVAQIDPETENGIFNSNSVFDVSFYDIVDEFEIMTIQILTDPDPYVRVSLLKNITVLCSFFGRDKTNDVILSHLITYLNDKDPQIRLMFVNTIVSISIFVGVISLEQYILPLLIQSLNDPDELVVTSVIKVFTELIKLGLVRKNYTWDLIKLTAKLILHPNEWIGNGVLSLIITIANHVSVADLYCMLYPIIRPFFQYEVSDFSWETLFTSAHKPISRPVYNLAKAWCLKTDPTLFWQRVDNNRQTNSLGGTGLSFYVRRASSTSSSSTSSSIQRFNSQGAGDTSVVNNSEIPLSQSDVKQVAKLKGVGMGEKDLWKIATMRSYIYKVARLSNRAGVSPTPQTTENVEDTYDLQRNSVLPRTVFLDITHKSYMSQATKSIKNHNETSGGNSLVTPSPDVPFHVSLLGLKLENAGDASQDKENNTNGLSHMHANIDYEKLTTDVKYSYVGNNPYILKFLDAMKFEPSLDDYKEFGPVLRNASILDATQNLSNEPKKAQTQGGQLLVAKLLEHKSSVNAISVSPDNKYFLTGDEDGHLKFWDSLRLENNVTCSSILSLPFGSAILSICSMKDRDCFAVATKDGLIQVFKVRIGGKASSSFSSANVEVTMIRHYRVPQEDKYALKVGFSITAERPYLVYITPTSKCCVLDIRGMKPTIVLKNDVSHGVLTDFVIDSKQSWILLSTARGILDLWDLVFELHLKSAQFKKKSYPIKSIKLLPSSYILNRRKDKFVAVIGGTGESDITVWDVSKLQCREAYISSSANSTLETYSVTDISKEELDSSINLVNISENVLGRDNSCTALAVNESNSLQKRQLFVIGATSNFKIIQWNVANPENSRVIAGARGNDSSAFSSTQLNSNMMFINERTTSDSSIIETPVKKGFRTRTTFISREHQDNMRNHYDVVTAIEMLNVPYDMVISADRSGVISVFR